MALYASKIRFSRRKLKILVKRTKLQRLNSRIFPCLRFHTSLKQKLSNKVRNNKIILNNKKRAPFLYHNSFNRSMRRDFFNRFKRDGFNTQFRYQNGNGARDKELFKLMDKYEMKKYEITTYNLNCIDSSDFITIFTKDSNTDNFDKLINNEDKVKISFDRIGIEALEYIKDNDLVCVAYYDEHYGDYIEGFYVYSKDYMSHEYYNLMHY